MRISLPIVVNYLLHVGSIATALQHSGTSPRLRQLYEFPYSIFLENLAVRPNGHLLINTFDDARIFGLDPSKQNQDPAVVAQLPGVTAASGIAEVAPDVFATSGGILNIKTAKLEKGSGKIFLLEPIDNQMSLSVKTVATVPDTESLNGMASLPLNPHIVLSVDHIQGRIIRIDTNTGGVDVAFQHPLLGTGNVTTLGTIGGNGLKIHDGYLYFTNSIQQFFGRIRITCKGVPIGTIEEIVSFVGINNLKFDDFSITREGDSYLTAHPNTLVKVSSDRNQVFITGEEDNITLLDPTSAALSRNEQKLYIVTAGSRVVDDGAHGGQVLELRL